jgi:hypothetical protein
VISNSGFSSIVHLGLAQYQLTLTSPPPDANIIPGLTALNGIAAVVSVLGGVITVATATIVGVPADQQFFIVVVDNS